MQTNVKIPAVSMVDVVKDVTPHIIICRLVPGRTHSKNPIGVVRGSKVKDFFFHAKVLPSIGRKRS